MNWRFTIAVAVMFVLMFFLGWLVHGGLLGDDYQRIRPLMRSPEETRANILYVFGAQLCTSAALVWIYRQGREERPWLGQGLRFGIAVALLATIPINLLQYATLPLPLDFMIKRLCYDVAIVIVMSVVLAFIYRGVPEKNG